VNSVRLRLTESVRLDVLISKEPGWCSRCVTVTATERARKHVSISGRCYRYFSFWKRQADTESQLTYSMGSDNTFQGKKRTKRETDDLPRPNAEVRNSGTTLLSKTHYKMKTRFVAITYIMFWVCLIGNQTRRVAPDKETGRTAWCNG